MAYFNMVFGAFLKAHKYIPDNSFKNEQDEIEFAISYLRTKEIPFKAIEVEQPVIDTISLSHLPKAFLAVDKRTNTWIFVSKNDGSFNCFNGSHKIELSPTQFIDIWGRKIITIEEKVRSRNWFINSESNFVIGAAALILIAMLFMENFRSLLPFVMNFLGLIICKNILDRSTLQNRTEKADFYCGESENCDTLHDSVNLIFNLSLADLGLIYFTFFSCLQLISGISLNNSFETLFFPLSLFGVIAAIASIYLQAFSLKKWCVKCCLVCLVLFVNGLYYSVQTHLIFFSIDFNLVILSATLFIIWCSCYLKVKSIIKQNEGFGKVSKQLLSLRNNNFFLPYFLQQQPSHTLPEILLDKKDQKIEILIYSKQNCETCRLSNDMMLRLIDKYPDNLHFTYILTDDYQGGYLTYACMKKCTTSIDYGKAFKVLKSDRIEIENWYQEIDPVNMFIEEYQSLINWSKDELRYSPTIFINRKLFPEFLSPLDLEFLIEDIIKIELTKSSNTAEKKADGIELENFLDGQPMASLSPN